jgi:HPt (histidine-containing phosphotransfer) domain-containing protein
MTTKTSKNAAKKALTVDEDLLTEITSGLELDDRVKKEVIEVAVQIKVSAGGLTSTDIAQFRDLATICQKIEDSLIMTKVAKEAGDAHTWSSLNRLYQALLDSKRKLMGDLRATRAKRSGVNETAAERKSKEKSGSGWGGVI